MTEQVGRPSARSRSRPRRHAWLAERSELGPFTSAIVPVYNEQGTVANVVEALLASDHVDEIVCVDDGSTDASLAVLRSFERRIVVIELDQNRGKGCALAEGVWRAHGTIVAFFDADLTNLADDHLRDLLQPLRDGAARAALGFFPGDSAYSRLIARVTGPRFTGERAYYRRDLLKHLPRMARTGFGVEVYLNGLFTEQETAIVPLPGLAGLGKEDKHRPGVATREYAGELLEVTREIVRTRLAWDRR